MLHDVEIDWGWPQLTREERAIVRRYEARLQADRKAYTIESAERVLLAAAAELPGRLIRARAADDDQVYVWQIVEGDLYDGDEFDEAGMCPEELTANDFIAAGVKIVRTPIVFPESMLRVIYNRGWQSLSTLIQGAWQIAGAELPAGFRTPDGPRRMQSVFLPVELWAQLKQRAKAEERSVSYLVQRAVTVACELPVH